MQAISSTSPWLEQTDEGLQDVDGAEAQPGLLGGSAQARAKEVAAELEAVQGA